MSLPEHLGNVSAMFDVIPTEFGFIATGRVRGGGYVWTSTDGRVWDAVPDESVFGGQGEKWINAVTPGGPGYVAVGMERPRDGSKTGAAVVWSGGLIAVGSAADGPQGEIWIKARGA